MGNWCTWFGQKTRNKREQMKMVGIAVVTEAGLLIVRRASTWTVDERLGGRSPECVAVDLRRPAQVYCGTARAGLLRSRDSGRNWEPVGPGIDHPMVTAVTHPLAPGRIYSAAGDGYFESTDAGDSWTSPEDGLKHLYLVGVAVDPADPDTVIVSATEGPGTAYWPRSAKAYVYRKRGLKRWEQAMSGLPEAKGTTASRFATHAGEPGVIYAANNRGLFRSDDAGRSWKALDLPWPEPGLADGVEALACLPE